MIQKIDLQKMSEETNRPVSLLKKILSILYCSLEEAREAYREYSSRGEIKEATTALAYWEEFSREEIGEAKDFTQTLTALRRTSEDAKLTWESGWKKLTSFDASLDNGAEILLAIKDPILQAKFFEERIIPLVKVGPDFIKLHAIGVAIGTADIEALTRKAWDDWVTNRLSDCSGKKELLGLLECSRENSSVEIAILRKLVHFYMIAGFKEDKITMPS